MLLWNHSCAYPQKFIDLLPHARSVLDCGSGDRKIEGVINFDISKIATDVIGDGHYLPFKSDTFDLILSQAVLEHCRNPHQAAKELYRICAPDGLIYAEAAFMQPYHAIPYHFFNLTLTGIEEIFKDFEKVESGAFGPLSDTVPWMVRSTNAKDSRWLSIIKYALKKIDAQLTYEDLKIIGAGVYFLGRKS